MTASISVVQTIRTIMKTITEDGTQNEAPPNTEGYVESDTNADTCCLGKSFIVLQYTNRVAEVYSYDKTLQPKHGVPIVTGATAYDCPKTGRTYILIYNESLFYGNTLDHSLINPNQMRHYGVNVWDNPFDNQRGFGVDLGDGNPIPFEMRGTKIRFRTRVPTSNELMECQRIDMTSKTPWNPDKVRLCEVVRAPEEQAPWKRVIESTHTASRTVYLDPTSVEALLDQIDPILANLNDGRTIGEVVYDPNTEDVPVRNTFLSRHRGASKTEDMIAERFAIGLKRARSTLKATLQRGTRSAILPLSRRYHADRMFERKRLNGLFSSDTIYFPVKSLHGHTCSQLYYHKSGFVKSYHLTRPNDENVGESLTTFISEFGVPERLTVDGAKVQIGPNTSFMKTIKKEQIDYHVSHPRRPDENPAEGGVRIVKLKMYRFIEKYNIPMRLWTYVLDYTIEILNITTNSSRYSKGRTPLEIITGVTPDISEWMDFHIYEWVYYRTNAGLGPRELGRWLGVSHRVGRLMTYWILPKSGRPISCDTVQRVTAAEKATTEVQEQMGTWEESVKHILHAKSSEITAMPDKVPQSHIFDLENESDEFVEEYSRVITDPSLPDADKQGTCAEKEEIIEVEHDDYAGMTVNIRRGGEGSEKRARVKKRVRDDEGRLIGMKHPTNNLLLDTRLYEVEYLDGSSEVLSVNILAENILAQVDEDGHRHLMIDEISDHRTTKDAIPKEKGTFKTRSGATRKVRTTRGWEFYVIWKDGSGSWVSMKDLKASYPYELGEYGRSRGLLEEPAFAWWVSHVLNKTRRVLAKIKSKYWERTHKYGIEIPKNIKDCQRIDEANGNSLWMDAVRLEMKNVRIAFEKHEGKISDLDDYQEITGHLVFDVKLGENFRRKARYCADGHKTEAPSAITYSSVVSRDSVRIMLMVAALNELDLQSADVQNAFLTAPNLEKVWLRAGPEFGDEEDCVFIVRRALYGLKSASASFRAFMADRLDEMGFKSSVADPDVWYRAAVKHDGSEYYEYVLAYVDDVLTIGVDATAIMKEIGERFKFKNDEIKPPSSYLGAKLAKKKLDGIDIWTMTSQDYIDAALQTVQAGIKDTRWKIPVKVQTPIAAGNIPELDDTPELDANEVT